LTLDGRVRVAAHRRLILLVSAGLSVLGGLGGLGRLEVLEAQGDTARVLRVRLEGVVNPIEARHVARAIDDARRDRIGLILLSIDTPGGLVTSMQDIVAAISSSPVPVVGVVEPATAQATSAGALLLLATDVAVMFPDTRVGSAHPVGAGAPLEGAMEEKATNSMATLAKSLAARRGRSEQAAEAMVRQSVSYTAQEALDNKLIELIVNGSAELLAKLDGYKLDFRGRKIALQTRGAELIDSELSTAERILDAVADPTLASILLTLGVMAILYEFSAPGIGLGGIIGVSSLLLGLLAMSVLPIRIAGVLLLLAGLIAIALEVKTASGLLGAGGLCAIVLGAIVLIDETRYFGQAPQIRWSLFVPVVVFISACVLGLATVAAKSQRAPPRLGLEALRGARGVVKTRVSPETDALDGSVWVDGGRWQAVSDSELAEGETIEVVDVLTRPTRLKVRRANGES
jgi:membrane-bound serine protease (ClpP class)